VNDEKGQDIPFAILGPNPNILEKNTLVFEPSQYSAEKK